MTTRRDLIKFRRGTAAEWTNSDPQPGGEVLRLGEPGYEKDTGKLKIGDGVTPWNSLPYLQAENNQDVILQPEDVQDVIGASGFLVPGTGMNIVYDDNNDNLIISTSGVSLEGHTHISTDITDSTSFGRNILTAASYAAQNKLSWQIINNSITAAAGGQYIVPTNFTNPATITITDPTSPSHADWYVVIKPPGAGGLNGIITIGDTEYSTSSGLYLYRVYSNDSGPFPVVGSWKNYSLDKLHGHFSSDIVDFNTSVSGLIPVKDIINGSGTTVTNSSGIYSINVSASGISGEFDKISFSTTADPTIETAEIGWDAAEGTLDLGLEGGAKIHVGEHTYFRIRNNTGSILRAGQAVYASDVHNNSLIEASLYTADGSIREIRFIGLVLTDIDINQKGYAINFGHVENLDTRGNGAVNGAQNLYAADEPAWVEGDILYVHPTIPGKLTKVEPKHSISAAIVLYVHQNNGRIFVRPTSYGHLDDNHDVNLSGLADNNLLVYNSGTDNWEPSTNFTYNETNGATTISTENINNRFILSQYSNITTNSPRILLRKNSGSLDSPGPLASGDFIGSILFSTLGSGSVNQVLASIDSYTNDGTSGDITPTILRFNTSDASGTLQSNMFINSDGVVNCTKGSIVDWNQISQRYIAGKNYGFEVYAIPSRELASEESINGSLSWCFARIAENSTTNNVLGSAIVSQITIPNSGTQLDSDSNLVGQLITSVRNSSAEYADNGLLNSIVGNTIQYGHFPIASGTNPATNLGIGLSVSPFAGRGNIETTYDIYLGPTQQNLRIDEDTIITGDGTISNRYGIFQASNHANLLNGSLTVQDGLSAPTPIFDLGTVSNNVNINYGIDRQIQKITLDGSSSVNFLQGSNWPTTNHSVDVLLEIHVTSPNSVLVYWDIVDEWYNEPDVFVDGKYLVLLRSMSPSVIQGHYIGKATQVTTPFITDENGDRIMAENGDFILF